MHRPDVGPSRYLETPIWVVRRIRLKLRRGVVIIPTLRLRSMLASRRSSVTVRQLARFRRQRMNTVRLLMDKPDLLTSSARRLIVLWSNRTKLAPLLKQVPS